MSDLIPLFRLVLPACRLKRGPEASSSHWRHALSFEVPRMVLGSFVSHDHTHGAKQCVRVDRILSSQASAHSLVNPIFFRHLILWPFKRYLLHERVTFIISWTLRYTLRSCRLEHAPHWPKCVMCHFSGKSSRLSNDFKLYVPVLSLILMPQTPPRPVVILYLTHCRMSHKSPPVDRELKVHHP